MTSLDMPYQCGNCGALVDLTIQIEGDVREAREVAVTCDCGKVQWMTVDPDHRRGNMAETHRIGEQRESWAGKLTMRSWPMHNLIAHPLSEILHWLGLGRWGDRLHDRTLPVHEPGTGRG